MSGSYGATCNQGQGGPGATPGVNVIKLFSFALNSEGSYLVIEDNQSNLRPISGLYYKKFLIVNYDHGMLQIVVSLIDNARVVIYSFIVLAIVITIVNYDRTIITIINYDRKTFIVQATGYQFLKLYFIGNP
jgi:hypothetical protein